MTEKTENRSIVSDPEDGCIDIPHTIEAELALFQETRERLAMLEHHVGDPNKVKVLQKMSDDISQIMNVLNDTEEYKCNCEERHWG